MAMIQSTTFDRKQTAANGTFTSPGAFAEVVAQGIAHIAENPLLQRVDDGTFLMADYHAILCRLFAQVYSSSGTFAIAAGHCGPEYSEIRMYLLRHAEEEATHWKWILSDLEQTGYRGPDPQDLVPPVETLTYIALNHHLAVTRPIARLANAAVLEGFGGQFGKRYGDRVVELLGLEPKQMSFFLGHGDTDVGHSQEIQDVLGRSDLTEMDWKWMCRAGEAAARAYREIWAAGD